MSAPLIEFDRVSKYFGGVIALQDVSFQIHRGGIACCLLGDNGAGKSTLIKTLSGVHKPDAGEIRIDGAPVQFNSPRDAMNHGIATVYQDLALVPLMSIARNFFMGREPVKRFLGIPVFDTAQAARVSLQQLDEFGIQIADAEQAVGTLSGGQRQCLAIARAVYFGAKILILDEPTAALGVKQSANVLKMIMRVKARGIGIIFITHNVQHATLVGDTFSVLNRGTTLGFYQKSDITADQLYNKMAGDREMTDLTSDIQKLQQSLAAPPTPSTHA